MKLQRVLVVAGLSAFGCAFDVPSQSEARTKVLSAQLDAGGTSHQSQLGYYSQSAALALTGKSVGALMQSELAVERRQGCAAVALSWLASDHPYLMLPRNSAQPNAATKAERSTEAAAVMQSIAETLQITTTPRLAVNDVPRPLWIYRHFREACASAHEPAAEVFPISPITHVQLGEVVRALSEVQGTVPTLFKRLDARWFQAAQFLQFGETASSLVRWPPHLRWPSSLGNMDLRRVSSLHEAHQLLGCHVLELEVHTSPALLTVLHGRTNAYYHVALPYLGQTDWQWLPLVASMNLKHVDVADTTMRFPRDMEVIGGALSFTARPTQAGPVNWTLPADSAAAELFDGEQKALSVYPSSARQRPSLAFCELLRSAGGA